MSRRTILKVGAVGAAGVAIGVGKAFVEPALAQRGLLSINGVFAGAATAIADLVHIEAFPKSPLILEPFKDQLPIPKALRTIPQSEYLGWKKPPGPGDGQQNAMGNERHQIWPSHLDLVALDPRESVIVYRGFRDFVGPYLAHFHNVAHEDHAIMFGWEIIP